MTAQVADLIYSVLVLHCGADDKSDGTWKPRADFVQAMCGDKPPEEYRFQGDLGFGGKFRNVQHRPPGKGNWYVDCYPEHENPDRLARMEAANIRLLELHSKFGSLQSSQS